MSNSYSQIAVMLDQELDISRRTTLIERLQRIYGVIEARVDFRDFRKITVFYRDGTLGPVTLLDYLSRQNAPASLVPSAPAPVHDDAAMQSSDASIIASN